MRPAEAYGPGTLETPKRSKPAPPNAHKSERERERERKKTKKKTMRKKERKFEKKIHKERKKERMKERKKKILTDPRQGACVDCESIGGGLRANPS